MDKIDLPVLPETTTLKSALDLLSMIGISALITTVAGKRVVLDAPALLVKGRTGRTQLAEIEPTRITIDLAEPERGLSDVAERALDTRGAEIGIGEAEEGKATVYTRHEGIAADLGLQPAYCYCTHPDRHVYAPGDMAVPGICDEDGSPVICTSAP